MKSDLALKVVATRMAAEFLSDQNNSVVTSVAHSRACGRFWCCSLDVEQVGLSLPFCHLCKLRWSERISISIVMRVLKGLVQDH